MKKKQKKTTQFAVFEKFPLKGRKRNKRYECISIQISPNPKNPHGQEARTNSVKKRTILIHCLPREKVLKTSHCNSGAHFLQNAPTEN